MCRTGQMQEWGSLSWFSIAIDQGDHFAWTTWCWCQGHPSFCHLLFRVENKSRYPTAFFLAWWTTFLFNRTVTNYSNVILPVPLFPVQALVDGPCSGVGRKSMPFKQMHLTKFVMKLSPSARSGTVRKRWEAEEISKKWEETTWAKKIANREKVWGFLQLSLRAGTKEWYYRSLTVT